MIGQSLNANAQNSKPQTWTRARVTGFLGRVTRGALLSVGALTVAGVTGAGFLSQVSGIPTNEQLPLLGCCCCDDSLLQQAAKQGLQLPKDFILVMDFDGTKLVEKADPRTKVMM